MIFNALRCRLLYGAALLAVALVLSGAAKAQVIFNLTTGWNLLGNSSAAPIDVATTFGDSSKITTVWKWNKTASRWAFYSPRMTASDLATYSQAKGYGALTSIAPKEGFWVNSSTIVSINTSTANAVTLIDSDLTLGWNLVASADEMTPAELTAGLQSYLGAAGKAVQSIWSWDVAAAKWRFYAPSLDAQGGTVLTDYIGSKGYLPFNGQISAAEGAWVNVGAVTPSVDLQATPCAVMPKMLGDIVAPSEYSGSFTIPSATQTLPPSVTRAIGVKDYYPGGLQQGSACQDKTLHARNLYIETLNRLQQDGVQQTFLYNYGSWDDFSKSIWSVSPNDYQIPPSEVAFFVSEANKRNIKVVLAWQFTAVDKKGGALPMGGTKTPAELRQMLAAFHPLIVEQARVGQQIGLGGIYADWHAFWVSNLSSDPVLRDIWITEMVSIIADIRKVFSGKILYGANTAVMDPRIAAVIDQFTLSLAVPYQSIGANENSNLSVAMVKAAYLSSIQQAKAEYDRQMVGSSISVPINWAVSPQSKYNYFVEGWTEDGFCVNNCAQLNYKTDYSVQAIGVEAALQAITSQSYFTNGTVDIDCAYWHTDDVGPDNMGWDDYAKINNWDFPNLSQSIRNKPAETIVRRWFKQ